MKKSWHRHELKDVALVVGDLDYRRSIFLHSENSTSDAVLIHEDEFVSVDLVGHRLCIDGTGDEGARDQTAEEPGGESQYDYEFDAHESIMGHRANVFGSVIC